jgi:hypothetical protein
MRIIGTIEHPTLRISVFRNDNRTSVKFENERYEQTFKLGDDERFATVAGVQQLVDAQMAEEVSRLFQQMHQLAMTTHLRVFPASESLIFEEII